MTETKYDIVGIGNAIVDILTYKDDEFLKSHDLIKGAMTLVDEAEATRLYQLMGAATECSGGSAANTLAGFAMLGGEAAFIGKVKNDQLGEIFHQSLSKINVNFNTPMADSGDGTAKCLIFVTEEKGQFDKVTNVERTMATYLGASINITEDDIDEELIKSSKIMYFEGYLWDSQTARNAIRKAIDIAKGAGRKVAFALSDPLCVERHHEEFLNLVDNHVDILFCNESEIQALCLEKDIRKIIYNITGKCEVAAVTRSEKGSYIITDGSVYTIDAERTNDVYDVTGAGDLYASGFLYGYINGFGPEKSARLASLCATEVIKYIGARPVTKLSTLLDEFKS